MYNKKNLIIYKKFYGIIPYNNICRNWWIKRDTSFIKVKNNKNRGSNLKEYNLENFNIKIED